MHEMSIAEGILDVALDTLRQHDATVIHSIQLDLGLMSGVEPDSLLFCWEAITCLDCDKIFFVKNYTFICPYCDSHFVQTIGGRELQVTSIDID